MRALGVVGVLLTGCTAPGVTIEAATSDPAIKRVELFVGAFCDGDCPDRVAPPGMSSKQTDVFLVDDPRVWSANVVDGVAGFVLRADHDQEVPVIVAVGFDMPEGGNPKAVATLHDVVIPAGAAVRWRVPLVSALPVQDTGSSEAERVALWRQVAAPGLACVMVEHWSSNAVTRDLLVPRDDHDCDQLPAGECAPWTYHAMSSQGTIDSASCLVLGATGGKTICMLGGPTCSEVGGSTRPCEILDDNYCAPMALCSTCAPWDEACVASQIRTSTSNVPRIACDLPLTATGNPCNGSETKLDIDAAAFLTTSTAHCKDVRINDVRTPLSAFGSSVVIGSAKLEITEFAPPCSFTVKWTGQITGERVEALLVDLVLDNGNHLVIPFALALVINASACTQVMPRCQALLDNAALDPMFSCAGPSAPVGSCDPQGGCPNGPPCGTGCCGSGESCVAGECRCGTSPACGGGFTCNAGMSAPGCGSSCCNPLGGTPLCTF